MLSLSIWILTSESWFCQNICWFWIWGPSWLCWSIWETLWCCEAHQSTSCLLAFKKIINNWRLSLEMFKKKLKKNSGRNPKKNQEEIQKVYQSTSWLPSKRSSITEDSPSGQVAKYLLRSFKIQIYTVHDLEFWKCSTCQFARILSHSRSFSQKLWCIYRFQNTNNTISLFPQYLDREMLIVLELSLQQIFIFPKFKLKHDWTLLSLKELSCKVRVSRNKDIWSYKSFILLQSKKTMKMGENWGWNSELCNSSLSEKPWRPLKGHPAPHVLEGFLGNITRIFLGNITRIFVGNITKIFLENITRIIAGPQFALSANQVSKK